MTEKYGVANVSTQYGSLALASCADQLLHAEMDKRFENADWRTLRVEMEVSEYGWLCRVSVLAERGES